MLLRHLLIGGLVVVPVASAVAMVTSATDPTPKAVEAKPLVAKAVLKNLQGKTVGSAVLTQTPDGVRVALQASGLPQGELAMHIHEKGACDAKGKFASAGGHFNPAGKKHGLKHEEGAHAGDMPNLMVNAAGKADVTVMNSGISLMKGVPTSVFDADGSALVIHAKADDNVSQPAGDAGDRLVCGILQAG